MCLSQRLGNGIGFHVQVKYLFKKSIHSVSKAVIRMIDWELSQRYQWRMRLFIPKSLKSDNIFALIIHM